jgi:hypothetical protein
MIQDLDSTLRELLIREGKLDPSVVDIRFDVPTRERALAVTHPTIYVYLYDIRENAEQRQMQWDTVKEGDHRVRITRRPLRIDLSYKIICFAGDVRDQHRLLWQVLETLFRHSPVPNKLLQGDLQQLSQPVETKVAQPDGALKSPGELWSSMEIDFSPSINLVVTLDLDLNDIRIEPLVLARALKVGHAHETHRDGAQALEQKLEPGWEAAPMQLGGTVLDPEGQPLEAVAVRLISKSNGHAMQVGPSTTTDQDGRYRFQRVPVGEYVLVVEPPGQTPLQQPVRVITAERGEPLPDLVYRVEVSPSVRAKP